MKYSALHITIVITLTLFSASQTIYSQQEPADRKFGISCSLQDNQMDFLVPIMVSSNLSIAPAAGMVSLKDVGTDYHFGLMSKYYLSDEKVSPFIGARGIYLNYTPANGTGITDWLLGAAAGGEYFVDRHFSVGIEAQLNYTISDVHSSRFGNPGKNNANTATAVFATIYF